jgi:hypothetical protein
MFCSVSGCDPSKGHTGQSCRACVGSVLVPKTAHTGCNKKSFRNHFLCSSNKRAYKCRTLKWPSCYMHFEMQTWNPLKADIPLHADDIAVLRDLLGAELWREQRWAVTEMRNPRSCTSVSV